MDDKGLNIFDECAAECVHLCLQEEERSSSSWGNSKMRTHGTIAKFTEDSNKNGAIAKVRILVVL